VLEAEVDPRDRFIPKADSNFGQAKCPTLGWEAVIDMDDIQSPLNPDKGH